MKNKRHSPEAAARCFMITALAVSFFSFSGFTSAFAAGVSGMAGGTIGQAAPDRKATRTERGNEAGSVMLADIIVSFKLDYRMNGPTYGGERWVSPPAFTFAQGGKQLTVEARAQGLDDAGRPIAIDIKWIPADPGMVTVTPGEGNEVKITVRRAGESSLRVISRGVSKELSIKAATTQEGNAIEVKISQ